jgi:ABC-type branched-subunit amino acid transport system ATPase component/branched-subunit amino acid ABC-type transport system permease component
MSAAVDTILLGIGLGAIYALLGSGIVLIHRGAGVLNFGSAAVGMFGSFVAYSLHDSHGWPFLLAWIAGLAVSAAIGAAFHIVVMSRLRNAATTTRIVATLGLFTALIGIASLLYAPEGGAVGVPSIFPLTELHFIGLEMSEDLLLITVLAAAVTVGLVLIQRRTRFGLATIAVAEDPVIAGSMGCSPNVIASANWALGSAISMVGIFLIAPTSGLGVENLSLLVVEAMVVALIGGFESFPRAALGGVALGVAQSLVARYVANEAWDTAIPLLLIVVVLVARGRYIPAKGVGSERLAGVVPVGYGWAIIPFFVIAGLVIELISIQWMTALTITLTMSFVVLSIVVVSGFAGQLSLAQLSLAGLGAFFTTVFAVKVGWPMWADVLVAMAATAGVGMIVAVPSIRARGSSMAIASLAVANVLTALILNNQSFASLAAPLPSLHFLGMSFGPLFHARAFAMLCLVLLCLCLLVATNVRRGAAGRRLLAMRTNERASMALGHSVFGAKIYAFVLAGALAGLAGGLVEAQLLIADYTSSFPLTDSINSVLNSVFGGLGWPGGAVIGGSIAASGAGAKAISYIVSPGNWLYVISGVSAIIVVVQSPDGLLPFWVNGFKRALGKIHTPRVVKGPDATKDAMEAVATEPVARRTPVRIEANGITVRFGGQIALNNVSVAVNPGQVVGLIGPNGAGKSTLIEVISGFQRVESGTVLLEGASIDTLTPARRARAGVSRSFQALELFEDMSIIDNLRAASDECPPARWVTDLFWPRQTALREVARKAAEEFRLLDVADRLPHEVDYARRRLTAIARAVACDPGVVLLDEPAAGLDEVERAELANIIRELAREHNIGVLLIEHDVGWVFNLCDHVIALDAGNVIARGNPEEVRHDPKVVAAYLGPQEEDPMPTA